MDTQSLKKIRLEEKEYHEQCFETHKLFAGDSWLSEPAGLVIEYADRLEAAGPVRILDLGCGVGRNAIPLARRVRERGGEVVCVDLLDKALDKLKEYAGQYGVSGEIRRQQSDISDYVIEPDGFDYIVAGSCLEHVRSEELLEQVMDRIAAAVKRRGIVCVLMNTDIAEYNKPDGSPRETLFEVVLKKEKALALLQKHFTGWEKLHENEEPLELEINRGEDPVMLKAVSVSFVARKL